MGWAAIASAVVLSGFVGTLAYSANGISYEGVTPVEEKSLGTGVLLINGTAGIANAGFYALTGIHLSVHLLSRSGDVIARSLSPAADLKGGSTVHIPISLSLSTMDPQVAALFTNDTTLGVDAWVNATYAGLIPFRMTVAENYSWGAPFYHFSYSVGSPTPAGNGTETYPVDLRFTNHFAIPESGTLKLTLRSPSGAFCGRGSISIPGILLENQSFNGTAGITVPDACEVHGGTLDIVYLGTLFTLQLPPEPVP